MKKQIAKLLTLGLLLCALPLLAAGCGEPKPTDTLDAFLAALSQGDFASSQKYLETVPSIGGGSDLQFYALKTAIKNADGKLELFDNLVTLLNASNWEYTNTTINGTEATVTVHLTTFDFLAFYDQLKEQVGIKKFSEVKALLENNPDDLERIIGIVRQALTEAVQQKPMHAISNEFDVQLKQVGEKWKIVGAEAFYDDISNGLYSAVQK